MAISALNLWWFSDWQDLQDITRSSLLNWPTFFVFIAILETFMTPVGLLLSLSYHSLNLPQFLRCAIHPPYKLASVLLRQHCHAASTQLGEDHDPADRRRS